METFEKRQKLESKFLLCHWMMKLHFSTHR